MTRASEYKIAYGSGTDVEAAIKSLELDVNGLIEVGGSLSVASLCSTILIQS